MGDVKMITVLLTRYYSIFADFIYLISGRGYTHASLALDQENEYYYSFNIKGFRKEYPKKHRARGRESISYKLEVSIEDYERIKNRLEVMEQNKEKFHYSRLGVFFCLCHIPFRWKNHYFCSQFVAETIAMSKAVKLKKKASLYLPNDLAYELGCQSSLREILCNSI